MKVINKNKHSQFHDYVMHDTFADIPGVTSRAMFGGYGIYKNGGFYQKTANPGSHAPSVVISVDDIRAAMKNVVAGGGKILGAMDQSGKHTNEPQNIPGVGLWISIQDTEGNRVSMLQPKGM